MPIKTPSAKQKAKHPTEIIIDPVEAARAAGLRYDTDRKPGITRKKSGKTFRYILPDGKPLRDADTLTRIKSLVIPPAWTDVWISTHANGHLQATGRDARRRKQSRYHPHWREVRDETKYERMTLFADALPKIRTQVQRDLARDGMPRVKVLATIVSLMEATLIRVGNEEYARENHSYGLTTMRNRHVDVHGATITFEFQGKSRVHHTISLHDRKLAGIIKRCADIPGYELFQYLDHEGNHHNIGSQDVNDYLREITGEHFTAKDFRTWAGSVLACSLLSEFEPFSSETQAKKNIVQAVTAVAAKLGNTPSVCRKCYIHPGVLAAYMQGATARARRNVKAELAAQAHALRAEEHALLDLLAHHTSIGKTK